MQDWLDEGKAITLTYQWPFGVGKSVEVEEEDARGATNYVGNVALMTTRSLLATGAIMAAATSSEHSARHQPRQRGRQLGGLKMQFSIGYLPCFLEIHTNPLAPGLLDANLQGYGRGAGANLAVLSKFRMKIGIATRSLTEFSLWSGSLSYGNIVDSGVIDLSIGRVWLQHREREHSERCSEQGWAFIPDKPAFLRVIDVKRGCVAQLQPRLIKSCKYVTLSYVCGTRPRLELNESNRNALIIENGLTPYLETWMSNTVRDAMKTTDAIGERYLWVNAFVSVRTTAGKNRS
jgi:hypothetical protein